MNLRWTKSQRLAPQSEKPILAESARHPEIKRRFGQRLIKKVDDEWNPTPADNFAAIRLRLAPSMVFRRFQNRLVDAVQVSGRVAMIFKTIRTIGQLAVLE